MFNGLFCFSAPPAFGCLYNSNPCQKSPYRALSYFQLVVPRCIFFGGVCKCQVDTTFYPRDIVAASAHVPLLYLYFVPLGQFLRPCFSKVFRICANELQRSTCLPPNALIWLRRQGGGKIWPHYGRYTDDRCTDRCALSAKEAPPSSPELDDA